ncbi:MAG: hypothetical protein EA370_16690 [Wenzhouxiangella sp.]|nr:MAG: hypothetical protein EA370_16690 [Wenzhouxiangella sp.]
MRTTLTLDDDVAAKLQKLSQGQRIKDVANRALRLGLQTLEQGETEPPYSTTPSSGKPRIRNLDNVAEVIAESEADHWR